MKTANIKKNYFTEMWEPDCTHKDECSGKSKSNCDKCKHNKENINWLKDIFKNKKYPKPYNTDEYPLPYPTEKFTCEIR